MKKILLSVIGISVVILLMSEVIMTGMATGLQSQVPRNPVNFCDDVRYNIRGITVQKGTSTNALEVFVQNSGDAVTLNVLVEYQNGDSRVINEVARIGTNQKDSFRIDDVREDISRVLLTSKECPYVSDWLVREHITGL
jgi:hypothetical protein